MKLPESREWRAAADIRERARLITEAAIEVGPVLFFSLLVITLSFVPVFTLEAQEGALFGPLAFTKTYAMAAAAGLSVTLIPVLMFYFVRGRIPEERSNPVNRFLITLIPSAAQFCAPASEDNTLMRQDDRVAYRSPRAADAAR